MIRVQWRHDGDWFCGFYQSVVADWTPTKEAAMQFDGPSAFREFERKHFGAQPCWTKTEIRFVKVK